MLVSCIKNKLRWLEKLCIMAYLLDVIFFIIFANVMDLKLKMLP